jgi:DNA replication protein DnaC
VRHRPRVDRTRTPHLLHRFGLLVQDLLVAKRDLKLSRFIERLAAFEALIIDDLGYVQAKP